MEAEVDGAPTGQLKAGSGTATPTHWWQPRHVETNHTLRCEIGPLSLAVSRAASEWRLAWSSGEELFEDQHITLATEYSPLPEEEALERYAVARTSGSLRLRPLLLDRPVVVCPRQPMFIPAGESTTLYMSSPLCISIEVEATPLVLREIPSLRLSDTWFGPNTREGELCYAGQTRARNMLSELPKREHRAISPVRIENHATTTLPLEKLRLPLPALSVYGGADGHLWTEGLSLTRRDDSDLATLRVEPSAPQLAGAVELISGPRQASERGRLVRAFKLFFGQ